MKRQLLLRYIGEDGTLGGLKHNQVYSCTIRAGGGCFWVQWSENRSYPYASLDALLKNWRELGKEDSGKCG